MLVTYDVATADIFVFLVDISVRKYLFPYASVKSVTIWVKLLVNYYRLSIR